MELQQVEKFRAWFDGYVAGFYGDDEYVNANLKSKEQHSRRTCTEMLYLADELGLTENQRRIAEAIALLHDIGRFEQFARYRTYNDPRSTDHCLLGLEVLGKTKILEPLEKTERQLIEMAIEYHGLKKLPSDLNGQCLMFSKMIRDADKIDIFYVVTGYYEQYSADPENFIFDLELPDEPNCSPQVIEGLLEGERIDYKSLQTQNDMKLLQLAWIYDVNFAATLKRIRQRKFLEKIIGFLPKTGEIKKVKKKIFEYVDSAIKQAGQ